MDQQLQKQQKIDILQDLQGVQVDNGLVKFTSDEQQNSQSSNGNQVTLTSTLQGANTIKSQNENLLIEYDQQAFQVDDDDEDEDEEAVQIQIQEQNNQKFRDQLQKAEFNSIIGRVQQQKELNLNEKQPPLQLSGEKSILEIMSTQREENSNYTTPNKHQNFMSFTRQYPPSVQNFTNDQKLQKHKTVQLPQNYSTAKKQKFKNNPKKFEKNPTQLFENKGDDEENNYRDTSESEQSFNQIDKNIEIEKNIQYSSDEEQEEIIQNFDIQINELQKQNSKKNTDLQSLTNQQSDQQLQESTQQSKNSLSKLQKSENKEKEFLNQNINTDKTNDNKNENNQINNNKNNDNKLDFTDDDFDEMNIDVSDEEGKIGNIEEKMYQKNKENQMNQQQKDIHQKNQKIINSIQEYKIKPDVYKPPQPLQTMEGYLKKKSPSIFKGWQKRFIKIDDNVLYYYKSHRQQIMYQGCLNFNQISADLKPKFNSKGQLIQFTIQVKHDKREFIFKQHKTKKNKQQLQAQGLVYQDLQKWYDTIQQHINQSLGVMADLTFFANSKKFWREKRISNYDFIHTANTGDILLFRGKSFGSKTQRAFSGAEYDHAALILKKYGTYDIILFESTGRDGVGLISWKGFTKHKFQNLYDKLVIRYLDYERTDEFLDILDKFIKFALKKKYKFNISKMLQKKTKPGEDSLTNEKQTFFCSELIGAAYKQLGLLPQEKSACQYWPGDFTAKKNLQLLKGASLSEENLIDFNLLPNCLDEEPTQVQNNSNVKKEK